MRHVGQGTLDAVGLGIREIWGVSWREDTVGKAAEYVSDRNALTMSCTQLLRVDCQNHVRAWKKHTERDKR